MIVGHANDFVPSQSLADDTPHGEFKAVEIATVVPMIESIGLLVQIPEQVERFHGHVGSGQSALEQAPIVLNGVGVDFPIHVGDRVIDHLMGVASFQAFVGAQRIAVERRARFDVSDDLAEVQAKLDELIKSNAEARNEVIGLEKKGEDEINAIRADVSEEESR